MKWSARFKNKAFWISLASAVIILAQQLGFTFSKEETMELVNSILSIFIILGVVVDPTTPGIYDRNE